MNQTIGQKISSTPSTSSNPVPDRPQYICIHGHFYQPPRENAWLDTIELQDSAYPYHDWNERIDSECYASNVNARILDGEGFVRAIINNYSWISFNIGPTLFSWLESFAPKTYQGILLADEISRQRWDGHGNALAQVYNHIIMPLANAQDKRMQVVWGIADFQRRFKRFPAGMWLAETAVDVATLEVLAQEGIAFTILAPHQARRLRPIAADTNQQSLPWQELTEHHIDPSCAYQISLPSGKKMALFFYDGPISSAVAFENLLKNGEFLAQRLLHGFDSQRSWPQLIHIATDGETYGHHHRYGEMALAFCLHSLQQNTAVELTNYSRFLSQNPPLFEVEILENTSWSCSHGVERWRSDCGCKTGQKGDWQQKWRAPLRQCFDWLSQQVQEAFHSRGPAVFQAQQEEEAFCQYNYPFIVRSDEAQEQFFAQSFFQKSLSGEQKILALKLLEMRRNAVYMYTSCGWFFDEISGQESTQCLQYAARVLQLYKDLMQRDLEQEFLGILQAAPSNLPQFNNGKNTFELLVKPAAVDALKLGSHLAALSLFESYPEKWRFFSYDIQWHHYQQEKFGRTTYVVGMAEMSSRLTRQKEQVSFGVLHLGDHNIHGGVKLFYPQNLEEYQRMSSETLKIFQQSELTALIRAMDQFFSQNTFSLRHLFRDDQRRILKKVTRATLEEVENSFSGLYDNHSPLMNFLSDINVPLPNVYRHIAEFIKNTRLKEALESEVLDLPSIRDLIDKIQKWDLALDEQEVAGAFEHSLVELMQQLAEQGQQRQLLEFLNQYVQLCLDIPCSIDFSRAQNIFYVFLQKSPLPTLSPEKELLQALALKLKVIMHGP